MAIATPPAVDAALERAQRQFLAWRDVPAPRRGELVRAFGETVRAHKADLGRLITLETGKILQEGLGEVQEVIDICEFAVGLSRQLYGLTIASERPDHKLLETWHPLGVVGRDLAPSISRWRCGRGTPRWRWCAATRWCGSRRRRRRCRALALNGLLLRAARDNGFDPKA